jgi:hypothetical protein
LTVRQAHLYSDDCKQEDPDREDVSTLESTAPFEGQSPDITGDARIAYDPFRDAQEEGSDMCKRPSVPSLSRVLLAMSLLLLVRQAELSAQTGIIVGRVTDAATGQAIPTAQVFISELDLGTLTQANGAYTLLNVPAGCTDRGGTANRISRGDGECRGGRGRDRPQGLRPVRDRASVGCGDRHRNRRGHAEARPWKRGRAHRCGVSRDTASGSNRGGRGKHGSRRENDGAGDFGGCRLGNSHPLVELALALR